MNGTPRRSRFSSWTLHSIVAVLCVALLVPGDTLVLQAQPQQDQAAAAAPETVKVPNDQLDSLVAPIALYPDPLLSQTLVASTYPLEIIQLSQWLQKNKSLKDQALADAVKKQDWDPSIQAMAAFPDVVKQLAENIKWMTDLGNAFLAQQSDVMDAVQRMRAKAKDKGNLKTTEQQVVETRVVENKQVIVVEQSQPDVVYVPSYDPVVVYGAPAYPYPPIAYPPGYYAAGMAISFGVGMALGAAWGGGWGWNSGWGGNNNININRNNTYVNNSNRQSANRVNNRTGNGNTWQHNPQHRGGAPYGDRNTANRFGGSARGDSIANRQANARQNQGQLGNRQGARGERGGVGGRQEASGVNRGSMADRGGGRSDFYNRGSGGDLGSNRGGGGDRVGNQRVSGSSDRGGRSAFGGGGGGGGGGFSGSSARASSARGSSSMGSRGGGSRGGRGGGGRRR